MRNLPLPAMAALGAMWILGMWLDPPDAGVAPDIDSYERYARSMSHGFLPYRDFMLEYPPLSTLLFWLPWQLPELSYADAFGLEMLAFAWVAQVAGFRLGGPVVPWGMVALPPLFGTLVRERFDIAPAALVLLALLALRRDRSRTGFALLGVGTTVKLFPVLLVPVAMGWLMSRGRAREAWVGAGICLVVVAVICAPFVALRPDGLLWSARFHAERPVQIESTPATVVRVLGGEHVTGLPGRGDRFRSQGVDGGTADAVELVFLALFIAAYAGALLLGRRDLLAGSLAALLALVALGKVLSPQFLLFMVPLFLIHWREAAGRFGLAAAVLTAAYFPHHYRAYVAGEGYAEAAVGIRNLLLVAALAALFVDRKPVEAV